MNVQRRDKNKEINLNLNRTIEHLIGVLITINILTGLIDHQLVYLQNKENQTEKTPLTFIRSYVHKQSIHM